MITLKQFKAVTQNSAKIKSVKDFLRVLGGGKMRFRHWIERTSLIDRFFNTDFDKLEAKTLRVWRGFKRVSLTLPEDIDSLTLNQRLKLKNLLESPLDNALEVIAVALTLQYSGKKEFEDRDYERLLVKLTNTDFFKLYPYLTSIAKAVSESESRWSKLMHSEPTPEEINAGIKKLSRFSDLNTVKHICASFNLKPDEAEQLPYSLVMFEMYNNHLTNEVKENIVKNAK